VSRTGLAAHFGVTPREIGRVESLEVVGRTPSGRVRDLSFHGNGLALVLSRLDIRRALPHNGQILNSTDFSVNERGDGLVVLEGHGYGHGAGMCQWGAIGRARAGQDFVEILETYYPGAVLVNAYEGEDG
jgi:stage II sporulation protein D